MSLKDLTSAKHAEAESTPFMKAVFAGTLPFELWIDWTYQKSTFYGAIEQAAANSNLLDDLPDICRAKYLSEDYAEMSPNKNHVHLTSAKEYMEYLESIKDQPDRIMAHLYTWHMGDMFGGQMIKKIIPGPHRNLEFNDASNLKIKIREKLDDSMGPEANTAFDWAIKMMREYDSRLG